MYRGINKYSNILEGQDCERGVFLLSFSHQKMLPETEYLLPDSFQFRIKIKVMVSGIMFILATSFQGTIPTHFARFPLKPARVSAKTTSHCQAGKLS